MSAQHTPGPWDDIVVTRQSSPAYRRIDAGRKSIGFTYAMENKQEAEANTRLIVAAPELLETMITALPFVHAVYDEHPIVKQMRAAIAKARGEA